MITSTLPEVSLVEKPFTCITIWYALYLPFSCTLWHWWISGLIFPCYIGVGLLMALFSESSAYTGGDLVWFIFFMEASIYFSVLRRGWSIRVLLWWDKWYKIRQFCYWRPLLITYLRFSWLSTQWESFSFPDSIFIGSLVSNMSLDIFSGSLCSLVAFCTLRNAWKFKGKLSLDSMLLVAVLLFLLYPIINMPCDD